jgi:type IV fimbrial biogenesis protein FimT
MQQRGFTLIEVIMTLAIVAILVRVGGPALGDFVKNSRTTALTNDFLANAGVGRSESVKRGARVTLCASSNSTTATPSCTGGGATAWKLGYLVFVDVNQDGAYNSGTDTLLRVVEPLTGNVTLTSTGLTNADWFQYRPSGSTNVPAAGATFKLCDDRTGNFGRTITISITGRTQVTTVACP